MRHPVLEWWIEKVYDGAWLHQHVVILFNFPPKYVTEWDGGDCQPFP